MRKRINSLISILFLFLYGMVVSHNILPHHHHTESLQTRHNHHLHSDNQEHGHDHHYDHSDNLDHKSTSEIPGDLSHSFTGENHLEEITINQSYSIEYNDVVAEPIVRQFDQIYSISFVQLRLSHNIERPPILYEPPLGSFDPQRGPPHLS